MIIYLLLPLPALLTALAFRRLAAGGVVALWAITLVPLVVLMPVGSRDFSIYLRDYADLQTDPFADAVAQDPLYGSIAWVAGHLGVPSTVFYLCLAALALGVKLTALHRLGRGATLPIALYMCSFFYLHEFTQLRAALAIGLWMLGIEALPRSSARYLGLTLLGALVHAQAALGLLVYPLVRALRTRNRARLLACAALVVMALSVVGLSERITQQVLEHVPDPRVAIYLALAENSEGHPNPFSVMSLLAIAAALAGMLPGDRHDEAGERAPLASRPSTVVFTGLLLGSCALSTFAAVPVAAFRVSEHFFSLLPIAFWMAADHLSIGPRKRLLLWLVAGLFLYLFLIHSPYLLDPATGEPTREDQ